jgi:predicted ATPase
MADIQPFRAKDRFLPSLLNQKHKLPAPLTSFIGRQREIAEIISRLASGESVQANRLLTLTGPGGSGKTRLALQAAAELAGSFRDGAWWVELAALSDPGFIPQTIAGVFGLPEQPGKAVLPVLLEFLRGKQALLVLDNCEHLVADCARICQLLLTANPGLTILATSRESLGITGEVNWPVPALSLPALSPGKPPDQAVWLQSEAIRLFIERAGAVRPGFAVGAEEWPLLGQLCRQLDGLPLAIELAASRVNMLSLAQIVSRLDKRFKLLTAGNRTTLPRQQTLRALAD